MTWVLAPLVQTGCVVWTVSIHIAFRFRFCPNRLSLGRAGHQRIAHPARRAHTLGVVVLDTAGSLRGAGVLVQAWVDTSCRDACGVLRAVLVNSALHPDALDIGVALEARGTAASGLVVGGVALGVAGTWVVGHAGVQALAVGADFSVLTFTIRTAPDCNKEMFKRLVSICVEVNIHLLFLASSE